MQILLVGKEELPVHTTPIPSVDPQSSTSKYWHDDMAVSWPVQIRLSKEKTSGTAPYGEQHDQEIKLVYPSWRQTTAAYKITIKDLHIIKFYIFTLLSLYCAIFDET